MLNKPASPIYHNQPKTKAQNQKFSTPAAAVLQTSDEERPMKGRKVYETYTEARAAARALKFKNWQDYIANYRRDPLLVGHPSVLSQK